MAAHPSGPLELHLYPCPSPDRYWVTGTKETEGIRAVVVTNLSPGRFSSGVRQPTLAAAEANAPDADGRIRYHRRIGVYLLECPGAYMQEEAVRWNIKV